MFEYSDGYSKLDSRESTGSLSYYGVFSNGDGEFTLPSGPEGIDTEVWEEYSPKEHTGHDKYWRNKENGAFLTFDKGVEGKKGHFHLYTDSNFKTRIDANGNLSGTAKGMAKGSNRFHLKPRTTVNLTALSKTMSKLSNAFVVVDLFGVFSQRPDSPWDSRSGINPNATENRAYGLFDQNNPVGPIIYEFNKIGNDTIEVRFYESYYWNADYGFWRGSGMYRKDVYEQDAASGNYIRLD